MNFVFSELTYILLFNNLSSLNEIGEILISNLHIFLIHYPISKERKIRIIEKSLKAGQFSKNDLYLFMQEFSLLMICLESNEVIKLILDEEKINIL